MGLLKSLGVDLTHVPIQLIIFMVVYILIYQLAFKPYFLAYKKRLENTEGNQENSERYLVEAEELKAQYEEQAKKINAEYKSIYDESKNQAVKDYDGMMAESRNQAKKILEESKANVSEQFEKAKLQLQAEAPAVANEIVKKLIG